MLPEEIRPSLEAAAVELRQLAAEVGGGRLLATCTICLSFRPAEAVSESAGGDAPARVEHLAYFLYPLEEQTAHRPLRTSDVERALALLDELFLGYTLVSTLTHHLEPATADLSMLRFTLESHARLVRGSAYPEQTTEEIRKIMGPFEDWFRSTVGIGPSRAADIAWAIVRLEEARISALQETLRAADAAARDEWKSAKRKLPSQRSEDESSLIKTVANAAAAGMHGFIAQLALQSLRVLPVSRQDLAELVPGVSEQEWDALISLIGLTNESRQAMFDPLEVRRRPLLVFPNGSVALVDLSNALDCLLDAYEVAAKSDEALFQGQYRINKKNWTESKVRDCLTQLFPSSSVFAGLSYPDPDHPDGGTAELDAAVLWDPFLVLVEVKAKRFDPRGELGNLKRLRRDLRRNVEDAFEQARRALRYLSATSTPEFREIATGRLLRPDKQRTRRVYLLTISQNNIAGLLTQLASLRSLGLFADNEFPLALTLSDLDVLTGCCPGPDVFLHYIERRFAIAREFPDFFADELELFGAYLDRRLRMGELWEGPSHPPDGLCLTGFSDRFDKLMAYRRGELPDPPYIQLRLPQAVAAILADLETRRDWHSRWIAFCLLDLSTGLLETIGRAFREVRAATLRPGLFRTFTYSEGGVVLVIVGSIDATPDRLEERTAVRLKIEMYKQKASKGVGLGVLAADPTRPFHVAVWIESPWEPDPAMEEAARDPIPFVPVAGESQPARNQPCPCGSGKKFKRCCLQRAQQAEEMLRRQGRE